MQFQFLTVIAGFLAATQALPVSDLEARGTINDCGDSTFENHSSSGSPLISDCQAIVNRIAGSGTWNVQSGQHQLVEYGTCAFGLHSDLDIRIGNQDIIDLINASIQKFSWEGKVGASGEMTCLDDTVSKGKQKWGLYHN